MALGTIDGTAFGFLPASNYGLSGAGLPDIAFVTGCLTASCGLPPVIGFWLC